MQIFHCMGVSTLHSCFVKGYVVTISIKTKKNCHVKTEVSMYKRFYREIMH